jgi:hypothetical protein
MNLKIKKRNVEFVNWGGTHHNTLKQYLTRQGFHRKAKKSALKSTKRQQSAIKARLKLLTQIFFSVKSIYTCVTDDEIYFTVEGNEWQLKSYYKYEDHSATECYGARGL